MTSKAIEKRWIANFSKCPLIDEKANTLKGTFAYQLYYGKTDSSYPDDYPDNFINIYREIGKEYSEAAIEDILPFLDFIGINLRTALIVEHVKKYPADFTKLITKCNYILKTLAHHVDSIDIHNPFQENYGDIYFLASIASGESLSRKQLNLFADLELPELYGKSLSLPESYDKDAVITELFNRIENSNDSFFITGKAGTGKSTFIHYFAQTSKKRVLLTAFTGIAAINIGGITIHSFFKFPFDPLLPKDEKIPKFKEYQEVKKIIEHIDTIIIDEVSMLRSDVLEAIDYSLRINGGDPDKSFGGKQLLFVGDIFQLPPVVKLDEDIRRVIFDQVYKSEYFFDSPAFNELKPYFFEFQTTYRQKEDLEFVALLNRIRLCDVDDTILKKFNSRYDPTYRAKSDEFAIILASKNSIANHENNRRLAELPFAKFTFNATITGEFAEDKYPANLLLELKKHSQIIFIKNDNNKTGPRRWINGTIGKVEFISSDIIEVKLQDGRVHKIEKETWENRKYKYDKEKRKVVSELLGTFTQFPIKLAWSITIHKSQGLTFDKVIIDLGDGAFINGQLYTALSRCRKLDGIILKTKLQLKDILVDRRLFNFYNSFCKADINISDFVTLNKDFLIQLYSTHYTFSKDQICRYANILNWGSDGNAISDWDHDVLPIPGLRLNKYIDWRMINEWVVFDPFYGWQFPTDTKSEGKETYYEDIRKFPCDISEELKTRRSTRNLWFINSKYPIYGDSDELWDMCDEYDKGLQTFDVKATSVLNLNSINELSQLLEFDSTAYLYNYSFYESVIKVFAGNNFDFIQEVLEKALADQKRPPDILPF